MANDEENSSLATRVAVLEAKVRLIALTLKGFIAAAFAALVGWLFGKS